MVNRMLNNNWNPLKWANEAKEWFSVPQNQKFFFDDPNHDLDSFIKGDGQPLGVVAFNLKQIATWFSFKAEAMSHENLKTSIDLINTALSYQTRAYQIFALLNSSDRRLRKQGKIEFNEGSICLARLIAMGHLGEAGFLADKMIVGLHEGLFYGVDSTSVAPFIFDLFASWKGIDLKWDGMSIKRATAYDNFLMVWETQDMDAFMSGLLAAADYHMQRSQCLNDEDFFEFDCYLDRVHAVEIFAVLRLRQIKGLPIPLSIDHPVMNTPLAMLNEVVHFPKDDVLRRVCELIPLRKH
jgi:hypothetical protein